MFYSKRHRILFIHVGKTGGSSITEALAELTGARHQPFEKHARARDIQRVIKPWVWNRCFKFAFVRNPWDRAVSKFHYVHQIEQSDWVRQGSPSYLRALEKRGRYSNLSSFLIGPMRPQMMHHYTHNQSGECLLDFVGRYETLEDDFREVCRRVGLPFELPHVNRSRHGPYHEHYDFVSRHLVGLIYRRDVRLFDYSF